VELVKLLACCTMGKNVYTEIKCNNLLSLDDIVTIICHPLCMPEVKEAYVDFLNHCYIDTEVEMKEIYASGHMWNLFEKSFLVDINQLITNPAAASNKTLQAYVLNGVTNLLGSFFASPFSDQSAIVQSRQLIFVQLLQASHRLTQCRWLSLGDRFNVENCIRTLTESAKMRSISLPPELPLENPESVAAAAAAAAAATAARQKNIDLESIGVQAEGIFDCERSDAANLDLDGQGGRTFLRVLLHLIMHDYAPLVSGALHLLFRHFSQRQEVLQAFRQVGGEGK